MNIGFLCSQIPRPSYCVPLRTPGRPLFFLASPVALERLTSHSTLENGPAVTGTGARGYLRVTVRSFDRLFTFYRAAIPLGSES